MTGSPSINLASEPLGSLADPIRRRRTKPKDKGCPYNFSSSVIRAVLAAILILTCHYTTIYTESHTSFMNGNHGNWDKRREFMEESLAGKRWGGVKGPVYGLGIITGVSAALLIITLIPSLCCPRPMLPFQFMLIILYLLLFALSLQSLLSIRTQIPSLHLSSERFCLPPPEADIGPNSEYQSDSQNGEWASFWVGVPLQNVTMGFAAFCGVLEGGLEKGGKQCNSVRAAWIAGWCAVGGLMGLVLWEGWVFWKAWKGPERRQRKGSRDGAKERGVELR